jgi:hypothetical protein
MSIQTAVETLLLRVRQSAALLPKFWFADETVENETADNDISFRNKSSSKRSRRE